jgi:hypothetical protein
VLRQNRVLFPHPDLLLEAGDQLVAVAAQAEWAGLGEHLDSVAKSTGSGSGVQKQVVTNQGPAA